MTARLDTVRRCFSTLGCVDLTLPEILALAREHQVDGIELRGIAGAMHMPQYCAAQGIDKAHVNALSGIGGPELVVAGSSIKLCSVEERERAEFIDFCRWADSLAIPYVRVFGGGTWGEPLLDPDYTRATRFIGWWREQRAQHGWQVDLLLETHDAFSGSEPCLELNHRLPEPLSLIWDSHHTWRLGGECPEETWARMGHLVKHVHVKDSVDTPSARHPFTYVLPGDGQMPLREVMTNLLANNYPGFVSLEWERHWHPYLPHLREALARMDQQNWFWPTTREECEPCLRS